MSNKLSGINMNKETIEVRHSELQRSDSSSFRSVCPTCDVGLLLVQRDQITLSVLNEDRCVLCGQRFIYTDFDNLLKKELLEKELLKKEELINYIIDFWEEDTLHLSAIKRDHPAYNLIKGMDPEIVIPTVLKRIAKNPDGSLFFTILYEIVSKEEQPILQDKHRGIIKEQIKMWIKWGYNRGYLNE